MILITNNGNEKVKTSYVFLPKYQLLFLVTITLTLVTVSFLPIQAKQQKKTYQSTLSGNKISANKVVLKKIRSPRYFDYIPEKLIKADFTKLYKKAINIPAAQHLAINSYLQETLFFSNFQGIENFSPRVNREIIDAVISYYLSNPGFIWVSGSNVNNRAKQVLKVLSEAENWGLSKDHYAFNIKSSLLTNKPDMASIVRFELLLTLNTIRYIMDAHRGIINANKLSEYHDFPIKKLNINEIIVKLSNVAHPASFILSFHPFSKEFKALKKELIRLKSIPEKPEEKLVKIANKIFIRPGNRHEQLPKIIEGISTKASKELKESYAKLFKRYSTFTKYEKKLIQLIKSFQLENDLKADGIIGPNTISKIFEKPGLSKIKLIKYSMERLRWHPENFGKEYVFINVPNYQASYIKNNTEILSMKAIVGKISNQTNFFYDKIEKIVYHPYWVVPRSIIVNTMVPNLVKDYSYYDGKNYQIIDQKGKLVSSRNVNWSKVGIYPKYSIRQTPGPHNSLGEMKIIFPNKHLIYMHDTPKKNLFSYSERAFSHGCIRLNNPRHMAAAILNLQEAEIANRLKKGHHQERVGNKTPVYVAYFTAWPDKKGKIQYFYDIYERDKWLEKAIQKTNFLRVAKY